MSPEEMEQLLASAPTRRLSPEAEQRILSAVVNAAPTSPARWWTRRVPLWQAAAACILLSASAYALARKFAERPVEDDRQAIRDEAVNSANLVSMDQPIFGGAHPVSYRMDISKWQFQPNTTE